MSEESSAVVSHSDNGPGSIHYRLAVFRNVLDVSRFPMFSRLRIPVSRK